MSARRHLAWLFVLIALLFVTAPSQAQIQIKVNDTTFVKFGVLLQTQAEEMEDATGGHGQNIFIRRARVLMGGQIAPKVTFFAETDAPNLGKSMSTGTKNNQPSIFVQDAYVEYKVNDKLAVDAGFMLISPSRNGLQSAASLLPIDYGPHTFVNSAPTQSVAGRDTGVMAKGYLLNKKLEYRAGVFQGMRDQADRELRTTVRVQYNFLDPESGFFYTGTYLGKKKVFTVGAGIDRQHKYQAYAFDVFYDHPLKSGAVTLQLDHFRYDGGTFLKSLPDQTHTLFEGGYLIGKTNFMPVVQFCHKDLANAHIGDENRIGVGVNYFITGHNANVKFGFSKVNTKGAPATNQATVQLQLFYF